MPEHTDEKVTGGMEVQLLPSGEVEPKGKTPFTVDDEARGLIAGAFEAGMHELVVDYEHQSLSGTEAPAAGWVRTLEDRGEDGVWGTVEWTEKALGYIRDGEYRYVSPVVLIRKSDGRAVELIGAALTNLPAIEGMAPLGPAGNEDETVPARDDADAGPDYESLYNGLINSLGLGADATFEEVAAKVEPVTDPDAYVSRAVYEELERRYRESEADSLVACACTDGKITPALVPWAKAYAMGDPEGFRSFAAKASPVVPLGPANLADSPVDPQQSAVNGLLGIPDELYMRHLGAVSDL